MTLTDIQPGTGPLGGAIFLTLTGADFPPTPADVRVEVGGKVATLQGLTADTIMVRLPAGAADGRVTVKATDTRDSSEVSRDDLFAYKAPPQITSVDPDHGPQLGGYQVTLHGTDFWPNVTVEIDGVDAPVQSNKENTIVVNVPNGGTTGRVDVEVTDVDTNATVSEDFTYDSDPQVTSVTLDHGPTWGTIEVILSGTDLPDNALVGFGGTQATIVGPHSPNSIKVDLPPGTAGPVDVQIIDNDYGVRWDFPGLFQYDPDVTLTAVDIAQGPIAGGGQIKLTGTDFPPNVRVQINGAPATIVSRIADTEITITVPAGPANGGTFGIEAINTDYDRGLLFTDRYTYLLAPKVESVSPAQGPLAGGTEVIITGERFAGPVTVAFAGVAGVNPVVKDECTITCTTPPGAAAVAVDVKVVNSDAQEHTANGKFTYVAGLTIAEVSPAGGPVAGGTNVTITGSNFPAAVSVKFGTADATNIIRVDANTITCTTPSGVAGPVAVVVKDAAGPATATLAADASNAFVYCAGPASTHDNQILFLMDGEEYFGAFKQLMEEVIAEPPDPLTYVRLAFWMISKEVTLGGRVEFEESEHTLLKYIEKVLAAGHNVDIIAWYANWKSRQPNAEGKRVAHENDEFAAEIVKLDQAAQKNGAAGQVRIYLERFEGWTGCSNHQKICIFSKGGQRNVLVGGFNLALYYFDDATHHLKASWHDTAVWLKGPATTDVEKEWMRRWQRAVDMQASKITLNNLPNQVRSRYQALARGESRNTIRRRAVAITANNTAQTTYNAPDFAPVSVQVATTRSNRSDRYRDLRDLLLERISHANHYIYMENNQFTDPEIVRALYERQQAVPGLRIRIVTNQNGGGMGFLTRRAWLHLALRHPSLRIVHYKSGEADRFVVRGAIADAKWIVTDNYGKTFEGNWLEKDTLEFPGPMGSGPQKITFPKITKLECDFHFYAPMVFDFGGKTWWGPTIHSKLAIMDDRYVIIGTSNWTYRSMQYDGEIATFTDSPLFAAHVKNRLLTHFHQHRISDREDLMALRLSNAGDNFEQVAIADFKAAINDDPPGSCDTRRKRMIILPLEHPDDLGGLGDGAVPTGFSPPNYKWF